MTSRRFNSVILIALVCTVAFLTSCAAFSRNSSEGTVNAAARKKIAILPFYNASHSADAGDVITNLYALALFNEGRYIVEEPGNVRQFLIQEHVDWTGELGLDRIRLLAKRLKVDAVIMGSVEEYTYGSGRSNSPVVTVYARMINAKSGKLVWVNKHSRDGNEYVKIFDFGLVRTPTMLARKVVDEMIRTITWQ